MRTHAHVYRTATVAITVGQVNINLMCRVAIVLTVPQDITTMKKPVKVVGSVQVGNIRMKELKLVANTALKDTIHGKMNRIRGNTCNARRVPVGDTKTPRVRTSAKHALAGGLAHKKVIQI